MRFPDRLADVHKGQCGRIGVIAGSLEMMGAAALTAMAALRSGAGVVYVMTVSEAVPMMNLVYPELIVCPFSVLDSLVGKLDVVAIGPGLGSAALGLLTHCLSVFHGPMVVDADALQSGVVYRESVLTPHVGEFRRVFGDKNLEDAARESGQVVVLKGAHTQVSDGARVYVNDTGNSGMATAGSGDVLTGVIAGLIGQGMSRFDAAALGVKWHGAAGDLAFQEMGYGLIASDIVACLPKVRLRAF